MLAGKPILRKAIKAGFVGIKLTLSHRIALSHPSKEIEAIMEP